MKKEFDDGVFACPVCSSPLTQVGGSLVCPSRHSYDIAKEGYVNFLSGMKKSGDFTGDNALMSKARADFLGKGYYDILASAVTEALDRYISANARVLDICCGNGYYSAFVKNNSGKNPEIYGFDISKTMVRLASKLARDNTYFVGNLASVPVENGCFDAAMHLFAPFNEPEYLRLLKRGGVLLSVIPGEKHLWGLKKAVYDVPYLNDEKFPELSSFSVVEKIRAEGVIRLSSQEDIHNLFLMTPYYYRTSRTDQEKLEKLTELETEISFIIYVLSKA